MALTTIPRALGSTLIIDVNIVLNPTVPSMTTTVAHGRDGNVVASARDNVVKAIGRDGLVTARGR